MQMIRVHGTCVAIEGEGVLLRGKPGSGKSDLALRLIDAGASLVADDRTELTRRGDAILAAAPAAMAGRVGGVACAPRASRPRHPATASSWSPACPAPAARPPSNRSRISATRRS